MSVVEYFSVKVQKAAKLDATIPILQERLNIRKGLADKELVSKILYLETLHQLVDQQQDHKHGHQLFALAAHAIQAGELARTLNWLKPPQQWFPLNIASPERQPVLFRASSAAERSSS